MPYTKTIYKKDSSGKLRFLELTASGNLLIQKNGVLGSDKISERRTLITGKNKGKSNETTAHEQAILEVKSKIKKKLDKDYFESEENAKSEVVILPMLAKN